MNKDSIRIYSGTKIQMLNGAYLNLNKKGDGYIIKGEADIIPVKEVIQYEVKFCGAEYIATLNNKKEQYEYKYQLSEIDNETQERTPIHTYNFVCSPEERFDILKNLADALRAKNKDENVAVIVKTANFTLDDTIPCVGNYETGEETVRIDREL